MGPEVVCQSISNSEIEIIYSNPDNLKACLGADTMEVMVQNNTSQAIDAGMLLTIQFPQGVNVTGIVSSDFTLLSYSSVDNSYTYTSTYPQNSGAITSLVLILEVSCPIFNLLDNTSGASLDITSNIETEYVIDGLNSNLYGTTLSFNIAQTNIKTTVSPYNQTITLANDYDAFNQEVRYDIVGNSSISEFDLFFDIPFGLVFNQIDSVIINGNTVSGYSNPNLLSGSTYGTEFSAALMGMSQFESGDVILVYYNFSPECLNTVQVNYYTGVDCFGSCYFENDLGFVNLVQAPPLINFLVTNNNIVDYCGQVSSFELILSNEDPSGYTIYNPQLILILNYLNSISNFTINGETVTSGLPIATTGTLTFNLNNLQTTTGYVLDDSNNDGIFGEIIPGDTIIISFDYITNPSFLEDCPANITGNQIYGYINYKHTLCGPSPTINTTTFYDQYSNYNFTEPQINVVGSVSDGQTQSFEFCIDRYLNETQTLGLVSMLLDDQILYGSDIILPCGFDLVNATDAIWQSSSGAFTPVSISTSSVGDELIVHFQSSLGQIPIIANHIQGCLLIETIFNCDSCDSPATINFSGFGLFEDCPVQHNWACESVSFCTDCQPIDPCSLTGKINHTNFEVKRTSFGWTNSSMSTKVTQADVDMNPANYNVVGAYACDTIHIVLEGNVCGGVDDFTPYITFTKPLPINFPLLDVVNASIEINSVSYPIALTSSTDQTTYWSLEFENQSGPFLDGTSLKLNLDLVVSKSVISLPSFPYHNVSEFTGAFFTNTQWINGASPSMPDTSTFNDNYLIECLYPRQEFNFYKVLKYLYQPSSSVFCGNTTEIQKLRLGYQGGTSGDEFPNEFRPFNKFNDSLVFELTNPANIGNVFAVSSSILTTPLLTSQSAGLITIEPVSGNWPVYDKTNFNNWYQLEIQFDVSCENPSTITLKNKHIEFENYLYSDESCNELDSSISSVNHPFSTPNLIYSFINPIQDAFTPAINYDFNISNSTAIVAHYPYLLITYDPSLVSISAPGFAFYSWSPNQIFIEIGAIPAYSTLNDFITVTPLTCDVEQTTEILVESGFHCSGYPISSGTFEANDHCVIQNDTLQLTILKSNLNVDLLTSFSTDNPVNHCDGAFSVILQLYNDEKAPITDLSLQFDEIPGLSLISTSFHYPIPQGESFDPSGFDWSMVDISDFTLIPAATSSALQSGYTFYNNGLDAAATLDGFLENDGVNLYNFYHVKLDFIVDCDFDVNQVLNFVLNGQTNCNESIDLVTSTYINFIPPFDSLTIDLNFTDFICDTTSSQDNIIINISNNETTAFSDLSIELYCDSDNNGLFDPSIDQLLTQEPVLIGGSTTINPGEVSTVSFSTSSLPTCSDQVYIAVISTPDDCYCNYSLDVDTADCCECTISPGPGAVEILVTEVLDYVTYSQIEYSVTGYPNLISNLTGNPNDPALFIFDPYANSWNYPISFYPPCLDFAFLPSGDTVFFSYNTSILPLPHPIEVKLVYPSIEMDGDTCGNEFCSTNLLKFDCPTCYYENIDSMYCSTTNSFTMTEEQLSVNDLANIPRINIYPNPVTDFFSIESEFTVSQILLFDINLRLIDSFHFAKGESIYINCSELSSGIYFVEAELNDGTKTMLRVVKM